MGDLEKATRKAQEFRQREREILDAALALFLEEGEDRVTVEMIADRVGIDYLQAFRNQERNLPAADAAL